MVAVNYQFGEGTLQEVEKWAEPVVLALYRSHATRPLLTRPDFRSDFGRIASRAHHMNFPAESELSDGIGLEVLGERYTPHEVFGILLSLRKGEDFCGYVRQSIRTFARARLARA